MHDALLSLARRLARPSRRQADPVEQRRAISTAYYAVFHAIAGDAANLLVGAHETQSAAWGAIYRALEHRQAKEACQKAVQAGFSDEICAVARHFVLLQARRHIADYDPFFDPINDNVAGDVESAADAIARYFACPEPARRAFAVHLLFRPRR